MPDLRDIPPPSTAQGTAANVQFGIPRPPQQQILLYSPAEWEQFVYEWAHHLKQYATVRVLGSAGDMGIDIGGFTDDKGLFGVWDLYQCKHYASALCPSDATPEIAKVLWHSFKKEYLAPRKYYFVAPRECGISLKKLLLKPGDLRKYVQDNWTKQCAGAATKGVSIPLEGKFRDHFEAFDFNIFKQRTLMEVLDEHKKSPYHAIRFGGGLPSRPPVAPPPFETKEHDSRYVQQLFEAYSDHTKAPVSDLAALGLRKDLVDHFHRQRESFYHAEALRNFARDTVPGGTFEDLQSEVYAGVADVEAAVHSDGYARVNAVTQAAVGLNVTSNALISVTKVLDRKGICHQLANEDRLSWRKR